MTHSRFSMIAFLLPLVLGCGSPQFSPPGRELMRPLQTAISTRQVAWIDATEQKVVDQYEEGQISELEFNTLTALIEQSRSGDWKGAQQKLHRVMSEQRATSDDLARLTQSE